MSPRNPALYEATKSCIQGLLATAYQHYEESTQHLFLVKNERWIRSDSDDDIFVQPAEEEASLRPILFDLIPITRDLEELKEFERAMRADEVIASQLAVPLGAPGIPGTQLGIAELADRLTSEVFARSQEFDLDEAALEATYEEFERSLYEQTISSITLVPLVGLETDESIPLNEHLVLHRLSDEEVDLCIRSGLFRTSAVTDRMIVRSRAALRITNEYSKLAGYEYLREAVEHPRDDLLDGLRSAGEILQTIRLLIDGKITRAGAVNFSRTWILSGGHSSVASAPSDPREIACRIAASDAGRLSSLHAQLQLPRVRRHKAISLAVRRFSMAHERNVPEDVILDLMIAAEAIFLSDMDQLELSYRLALRAAFFLAESPEDRASVFRHMKRAYDARSKIAHGGEIKTVRNAEGSDVPLAEHAQVTREYLRRALQQLIDVAPSSGPLVSWDSLVLGYSPEGETS